MEALCRSRRQAVSAYERALELYPDNLRLKSRHGDARTVQIVATR